MIIYYKNEATKKGGLRMEEVGVITEQGDLGLGFNPISSEEAEKIKENADIDHHRSNGENEKEWC